MKAIPPILLQLLAALGLAGGIVALKENGSLRQLAAALLMLYLAALLDWYVFFSSLTHTTKRTKLAAGILSGLVFVLVWVWLIVIVRRENGG